MTDFSEENKQEVRRVFAKLRFHMKEGSFGGKFPFGKLRQYELDVLLGDPILREMIGDALRAITDADLAEFEAIARSRAPALVTIVMLFRELRARKAKADQKVEGMANEIARLQASLARAQQELGAARHELDDKTTELERVKKAVNEAKVVLAAEAAATRRREELERLRFLEAHAELRQTRRGRDG